MLSNHTGGPFILNTRGSGIVRSDRQQFAFSKTRIIKHKESKNVVIVELGLEKHSPAVYTFHYKQGWIFYYFDTIGVNDVVA